MMPARIIPCLLLSGKGFVKTLQFKNSVYLGDPLNIINIFNKKMVDEIVILDIDATTKNKPPDLNLLKRISSICFSPLTYGGGVNTLEVADSLFKTGVEKVCINSPAFKIPNLITTISNRYGSQSTVVSVNILSDNSGGQFIVDNKLKTIITGGSIIEKIHEFVELGAGEVFINDVTRDGTMRGYNTELISSISHSLEVPVIACGGCSSYPNLKDAIDAGASGAAAGSIFVFNGPKKAVLISYPDRQTIKEILND